MSSIFNYARFFGLWSPTGEGGLGLGVERQITLSNTKKILA